MALGYAQLHLGPLALHAFPEAYAEFKNCLLMVMYNEGVSIPALAAEWSLTNREDLASTLHAALLTSFGVQETTLPLLLRYLITVHNYFHIINGIPTPYHEVDSLLLPEKLSARNPRDHPNRHIPVNDVQVLQQALSIPQQDAFIALRLTNGDMDQAFKNELARIQLNQDFLLRMIFEWVPLSRLGGCITLNPSSWCNSYCDYRGIIDGGKLAHLLRGSGKDVVPMEPTGNSSVSQKIGRLKKVREALMNDEGIREAMVEILQMDPGFRASFPTVYFQLKLFEFRECLRLGLTNDAVVISTCDLVPLAKTYPELEPSLRSALILLAFPPNTPLPPGANPMVCCYFADLGFIASSLISLLLLQPQHPSSIAGPLYTMLGQKLQVTEPRILKMIKYLCCSHTEWFRQNIIPDRFEKVLRLHELKKAENSPLAAPRQDQQAVGGAPGIPPTDHQQPVPQGEEGIDEGSVTMLMEIMGFTRDQAVALLQENGGDVNEVLQVLIG